MSNNTANPTTEPTTMMIDYVPVEAARWIVLQLQQHARRHFPSRNDIDGIQYMFHSGTYSFYVRTYNNYNQNNNNPSTTTSTTTTNIAATSNNNNNNNKKGMITINELQNHIISRLSNKTTNSDGISRLKLTPSLRYIALIMYNNCPIEDDGIHYPNRTLLMNHLYDKKQILIEKIMKSFYLDYPNCTKSNDTFIQKLLHNYSTMITTTTRPSTSLSTNNNNNNDYNNYCTQKYIQQQQQLKQLSHTNNAKKYPPSSIITTNNNNTSSSSSHSSAFSSTIPVYPLAYFNQNNTMNNNNNNNYSIIATNTGTTTNPIRMTTTNTTNTTINTTASATTTTTTAVHQATTAAVGNNSNNNNNKRKSISTPQKKKTTKSSRTKIHHWPNRKSCGSFGIGVSLPVPTTTTTSSSDDDDDTDDDTFPSNGNHKTNTNNAINVDLIDSTPQTNEEKFIVNALYAMGFNDPKEILFSYRKLLRNRQQQNHKTITGKAVVTTTVAAAAFVPPPTTTTSKSTVTSTASTSNATSSIAANNHHQTTNGTTSTTTTTNNNNTLVSAPSIDDVMVDIITQREEADEAKKMDQARLLSEQSRKEEAKRRRDGIQLEFRNSIEQCTDITSLMNPKDKRLYSTSWILQDKTIYRTCKQNITNSTVTTFKLKLLSLLQWEKDVMKWYGSLPKAYFSYQVIRRLRNAIGMDIENAKKKGPSPASGSNCSTNSSNTELFCKQMQDETDKIQYAVNTLSQQVGGVPKLFRDALDRHMAMTGNDPNVLLDSDCNFPFDSRISAEIYKMESSSSSSSIPISSCVVSNNNNVIDLCLD